MSYRLNDEAKKVLSKVIGIPHEQLIEMTDEEINKYIEKKVGKKITWREGIKIEGLPIRTMESINKKIDNLKTNDGWNR